MTRKNAIEIKGLNKIYKATKTTPEKKALESVDLNIPQGSLFALLGPNGAGKSTMINIMAGLVVKSAGRVKIWDSDIDTDSRQARASIGVVPQEINLDPFFTPRQILDIQGGLYGVAKAERRTQELLDLVGLSDKADSYSRQLSGGMRRRLMVAKAMVHNPPILVLDEPTAGVDIELRQQLWANVKLLNEQGVTVLLTTHYLEEAEELCDRIAIINHGQLVAHEEKETLLARIDNKIIRFRFDKEIKSIPKAIDALGRVSIVGKRSVEISYSPEDMPVEKMIDAIHAAKYQIADITTDDSKLEDVFLQLTRG